MGLYDWINVRCKCPDCKKMSMREFQTKDTGCTMRTLKFGDRFDKRHCNFISFLDICDNCGCSIEAFGSLKKGILTDLEIYQYTIHLKKRKIIKNCYGFDGKKTTASKSNKNDSIKAGCGVLFKSGSGIIICGEERVDGCNFKCKRCLKEQKDAIASNKENDKKT